MRISEIRFNGAVCGQFVFEYDCSAITFHCPRALNFFVCLIVYLSFVYSNAI